MSIVCPVCRTPLDQDFGMVSCGKCSTMLVIDMNGDVALASQGTQESPPIEQELSSPEVPAIAIAEVAPGPEQPILPEQSIVPEPSEPGSSGAVSSEGSFSDMVPTPLPFADEISQFANSDSPKGPLTYDIVISGIDSADLRSRLIAALSDNKFEWIPADIIGKIRNGVVELVGLNPTKAHKVISRTRGLGLNVKWRQSFYS